MEPATINLHRKCGPQGVLSIAHSDVNHWEGHHQEGQGHSVSDRLSFSDTFGCLVWETRTMTSVDSQHSWEALRQEERLSLASASGWEGTAGSPHWAFHCLLVGSFALICCRMSAKYPAPPHPPKCTVHICG